MRGAAINVAAGSGQRFGSAGKAFAPVLGKPMAWWSLEAATAAHAVDEIVLVCGEHSRSAAKELLDRFESAKPIKLVLGGARRQDSAQAGLTATSATVDIVAVHDAARPLVRPAFFDQVIEAARSHGGAIVAVPVTDTIKRAKDGTVQETLPRDELVSVQTPQAFQKTLLLDAFTEAEKSGTTVTDEATLIESQGVPVRVVPGSADNIKVTYPPDILVAEALLRARAR
jgi:2-C-methyl-D-erythritol 4-phosphate cytidylyltransferase